MAASASRSAMVTGLSSDLLSITSSDLRTTIAHTIIAAPEACEISIGWIPQVLTMTLLKMCNGCSVMRLPLHTSGSCRMRQTFSLISALSLAMQNNMQQSHGVFARARQCLKPASQSENYSETHILFKGVGNRG